MSMTWKDIKLATLQKMFAAEGSTIPSDESTVDYIAGMPYAANEALQRLSTAGKFLNKSLVIAHNPSENLIPDSVAKAITAVNSKATFSVTAPGACAYYFEFSGKGTLTITVDGTVTNTVDLLSKGTYTSYKGVIPNNDNGDDGKVVLTITSSYPSTVKNVALYSDAFDADDEVPVYADKVRYNLKDLAEDFFCLIDNSIFYEGGGNPQYIQTSDYYRESDNVLLLDRDMPGCYTIYYNAYPPEITIGTEDDYVLPVDPEIAVLMPLYMASQLYKDDDSSIATLYRNEFEVAFNSLRDTSMSQGYEKFTSESGW